MEPGQKVIVTNEEISSFKIGEEVVFTGARLGSAYEFMKVINGIEIPQYLHEEHFVEVQDEH